VKIRTGRRNKRTLYLQLGDEASNNDPCIGFMVDGVDAELVAEALTSQWHLNEMKISAAVRDDPRGQTLAELRGPS
jgi:hypothetical protein